MKFVFNIIFLVLFFYTIPMAMNSLMIPALGLEALEQPWLFTIEAALWALWVSVEMSILGMIQLSKQASSAKN